MGLQRTLYSTQFLKLYLNERLEDGLTSALTNAQNYKNNLLSGLPVQSASIERTIPADNILILGKLGSVGRQQNGVETVKMDIKLFWASGTGLIPGEIPNIPGIDAVDTRLNFNHIDELTGNALEGKRSIIVVEPAGFTGYGILTNFSLDAGLGDFVTANLSFEGYGTPLIATQATKSNSITDYPASSVVVYTSQNVFLFDNDAANFTKIDPTETIKSAKFSLDIPTESISRLGAAITGCQSTDIVAYLSGHAEGVSQLTGNHLLVAKPPFKVSISYDGQFLTGSHAKDKITFGHLTIEPLFASITSQSYSQSAGEAAATMSFSSEGTSAKFKAYPPG